MSPGLVLLERHLEKNAGSTFREVLAHSERQGRCMYWGFQQRSPAWLKMIASLRNLTAESELPRLCIEAHSGIDYGVTWMDRFAQLRSLRSDFAARGLDMRMHFHVRLRSPLSHYISYYLWTRVERQARNPKRFGSTFAQWARGVPNLQSELLLSSLAAFTASFAANDHRELREWRERWSTPAKAAARRDLVLRTLKHYDLLGTTDQFYESTLLVARTLNWSVQDVAAPENLLKQAPLPSESCAGVPLTAVRGGGIVSKTTRRKLPWWCRDPSLDFKQEHQRVHQRVCPNRTECEQLIRAVAPVDYEIYTYAQQQLRAAIRTAGPEFATQLREMRHASTQTCVRCTPCRWQNLHPPQRPPKNSEQRERAAIFALAPNFSTPRACIQGDQRTMEIAWSEHVRGGRAKPHELIAELVPVQRDAAHAMDMRARLARRRGGAPSTRGSASSGRGGGRRRRDQMPLTSRGRISQRKDERMWRRDSSAKRKV